jgi:hypothetical protein
MDGWMDGQTDARGYNIICPFGHIKINVCLYRACFVLFQIESIFYLKKKNLNKRAMMTLKLLTCI